MIVEVTFEERDGGTLLTVVDTFASDEDRDAIMRDGAVAGWSESMERLETLVTAA
jgi:Activator of Hsp90 ATPase homolog 1-like protein